MLDADRLMKLIEDLMGHTDRNKMKMAELFDQLRETRSVIDAFLKQHDKAGI